MLRAMKEQLKILALDEDKRFHNILRARIGKKATGLLENRLKQLIILMPDLVERIHYYYGHLQKDNSITKKLGGYMLTYLYHPTDFISEEEWGLFGYLDDAYFGAAVFEKIIHEVSVEDQILIEPDKKFNESLKLLKASARSVIPKEASKIDNMIQDIVNGEESSFFESVR